MECAHKMADFLLFFIFDRVASGYNEKTGVIKSEDTVGFPNLDVMPVKNEPEDSKTFQCDICPNPMVSSWCSEHF